LRSEPTKVALDEGLMVVSGTDSTRIGEYNPWRAIEYHVTGRAIGGSVQRRPEFALTRQQALRLYTSSAAWVTSDEGDRGAIEPGRLADLAKLEVGDGDVVRGGRSRRPTHHCTLGLPEFPAYPSVPINPSWRLLVPENLKALIRESVAHAAYTLAVLARIGKEGVCHAICGPPDAS
jgi:hypothetical protein